MIELKIKIKPSLRKKYNIKEREMNLEELEKIIRMEIVREKFDRVTQIAKETGLSKITQKEINKIIKETRQQRASTGH
jgi:Glu-tRNA(Gln) amidotransferase subunit E-like FAD-binding protein